MAHLRRGSTLVAAGEAVRVGQPVAVCGNSGNATEPHLHVQLMDHKNALFATGLPMRFDPAKLVGDHPSGMPHSNEALIARPPDGHHGPPRKVP